MKYAYLLAAASLATSIALAGTAIAQDKTQLAFIVNGASDFWKLAEAGVAKAQKELPNYEILFKYPERADAAIQQRVLDDLIAAGVKSIAISPVDPKTQSDALKKAGESIPIWTFDSDAADSGRVAYFGSSNVELGKNAGQVAADNMPSGTKCIGFVGNTGADNARERIEGFKAAASAKGIEMIDVRTDDHDQTRARANVDDALVAHPEVTCMVGFYSYNPPRIYEALRDAGKLGSISVVAFDEDPITLGAVKEGSFLATVVQQPFEWGYQGSLLMAKQLEGDTSGIPADGLIIIPGMIITKDNVDAFSADLKAKLGS
jgi:ribose transport system substrate-binding protein